MKQRVRILLSAKRRYLHGLDEVSENGRTLTLPNDDKIRILAVSVVEEDPAVIPGSRYTTR